MTRNRAVKQSGCSQTTCCAKQLPLIGKYSLKLVRFDILKYFRVICGPMRVFVAKHGVIMSHWGSVGVIGRSAGLNGAHWGSVGLSETQWGLHGSYWSSLGLSGCQWSSVGLSAQCIHTHLFQNRQIYPCRIYETS